MTVSTPIYLLKDKINFMAESKIKLIKYSFPNTQTLLKEATLTGYELKNIIDKLSLSKHNTADIEHSDNILKITMSSFSFFENALDVFNAHQHNLTNDMNINFKLMSLINKGDCDFPHLIEISCVRTIEKVEATVNLSSVLKNIYFDERSDIISSTLSIEKLIVDIIKNHSPNAVIQRKSKKTIKNVPINSATLVEKINFLKDNSITDNELIALLQILRKLRNNAAHDLSLTESVYNDSIFKLTSDFIHGAEKRYNLHACQVARFNKCMLYLFDEMSKLTSNENSTAYYLGSNNCNVWKSFFYGV